MATEAITPQVETPESTGPVAVETPSTTTTTTAAETVSTPESREQALKDAVGKSMDQTPGFEVTPKPAAAEPAKTPEQIAAETKAAEDAAKAAAPQTEEEKAAAGKAEEEKKAAGAAAKPEPNPLDKLGPLPVETLAKAMTDHPELAQALEKAGIDNELLYETARRAAETDQFREVFPTPEAARFAGESAQHFYDLEEAFPKIQSVEDFDKFVTNVMLPLSVLYGEDGKPLMSADGRGYQTDGSIERFLSTAVQFDTLGAVNAVNQIIAQAQRTPGEQGENMLAEAERVKEALMIVQEFRDSGGRLPGQRPASSELPPEVKAEMDRLRAQNAEAQKTRTQAAQQQQEAFEASITTDFDKAGTGFVKSTLDMTSLNDNEKGFIAEKAISQALAEMGKNRHYQMQKDHLYSLGMTPENKQAIVALASTTFKVAATRILADLVEKAGGKTISRQQEKLKKIDTQTANDRMNQGAGAPATGSAAPVLTSAQTRAKAIENYKAAHKGEMPDDGQILAETLKIRGF